jgi:serine/threonine protein phosphatase 1
MRDWLRSKWRTSHKYAAAPDGCTIYVIGDIHGRVDCLRRVQAAIDHDASSRQSDRILEIYLGDYIDRGPDSPAVMENLIARARLAEVIPLVGNHETLMTSFLDGSAAFSEWRSLGGLETAMSYGVSATRLNKGFELAPSDLAPCVPRAHLDFMAGLQPYFVAGAYCFVHAGVRPGVTVDRQTLHDLTWIREDFLEYPGSFGPIVVHGHTPVRDIEFHRHRINIDTGAYLSNKLSVLRIDAQGPAPLTVASQ